MKNCPYCGAEISGDVKFCTVCGAPLHETQSNTPSINTLPAVESRAASVGVALIKSVCFMLYFFGVQLIITMVYMFAVMANNISEIAFGDLDVIYELIGVRLHETMILSGLLTVLILGLIYALRKRKLSDEISLKPVPPFSLVKVAICSVAFQFAVAIGLSFIPVPEAMYEALETTSKLLMGGSAVMQIINIAIITPIVEEVIFRGFIYSKMRTVMPPLVAAIISGAMFGFVHGNIIAFVYATLLGIFMAMLFEKYNSIIPAIMCHIVFNGASLLTAFIPDNNVVLLTIFFISAVTLGLCMIWIFRSNNGQNTNKEE